nr:MAG TPA: hypothetical protein [Caudoviricetes sp.]
MNHEIVLYPNNVILVDALHRTRISYNRIDDTGIELRVDPISDVSHIEDDLDVLEDLATNIFDLYLKDPTLASKIVRPRYYYSDTHGKWIIQYLFK